MFFITKCNNFILCHNFTNEIIWDWFSIRGIFFFISTLSRKWMLLDVPKNAYLEYETRKNLKILKNKYWISLHNNEYFLKLFISNCIILYNFNFCCCSEFHSCVIIFILFSHSNQKLDLHLNEGYEKKKLMYCNKHSRNEHGFAPLDMACLWP